MIYWAMGDTRGWWEPWLTEAHTHTLKSESVIGQDITKESKTNRYAKSRHEGGNFTVLNMIFRNISWQTEYHSQSVEQCYERFWEGLAYHEVS